ncbi:MAG TPA: sulfatase-like hydrolase/transferase [Streptosporangiaceae bacterium]|nr:sulfatase-like hydrolase/transferase [Streptosporangiaceae bacterium]
MTSADPRPRRAGQALADAPNVLWILCDQLRTDALGCYGACHPSLATPEIDHLAEQGTRFGQCFVNSPVCVPSRTAMLTGLGPERTGVYDNEAQAPGYPCPHRLPTFPELFAQAGYCTATFGKSHVPAAVRPWQVEQQDGSRMREIAGRYSPRELAAVVRPETGAILAGAYPDSDHSYPGDQVTGNALRFLDEAGDAPFFMRVSYLQPHSPIVVPASHSGLYSDVDFGPGEVAAGTLSAFERRFLAVSEGRRLPEHDRAMVRRRYHQLVAWIDAQVGRLLGFLDDRGLRSRTIVALTADHGTYLGEGGALEKHTFAPQCHRVPLIVRWPGAVPAGKARHDLAQGLDIAPTLCGLAGITGLDGQGRDLFSAPPPEHVFATIGYGAPQSQALPNVGRGSYYGDRGWPRRACVRSGRYRLDRNVRLDGVAVGRGDPDEDVFLADTEADPAETRNVADEAGYAPVRRRLEDALDRHVAGAAEPDPGKVYRAFRPKSKSDHYA